MKVVLLAGGYGTRISEETDFRPKPMIEIGGRPILWHIMKLYSHYGFNNFIVCLGYKGYVIKEYFANYFLHMADVTFDMALNEMKIHRQKAEPWKVTLVDTGIDTMTGGRINRIKNYIGQCPFMVTYGDGLSNVPLDQLKEFHESHGKIATITAVQALGRFGALEIENTCEVKKFTEKPKGDGVWINGGFFIFQPEIFDYIDGDASVLEKKPLERLIMDSQLSAYKHSGFWQPMDTLREKRQLEKMWQSGEPPWKIWHD